MVDGPADMEAGIVWAQGHSGLKETSQKVATDWRSCQAFCAGGRGKLLELQKACQETLPDAHRFGQEPAEGGTQAGSSPLLHCFQWMLPCKAPGAVAATSVMWPPFSFLSVLTLGRV